MWRSWSCVTRSRFSNGTCLVRRFGLPRPTGPSSLFCCIDCPAMCCTRYGCWCAPRATDDTPTVCTFLTEATDAEKILLAARALREAAGTLTGMAAGEDIAREVHDVLADVRRVYYAGEAWI